MSSIKNRPRQGKHLATKNKKKQPAATGALSGETPPQSGRGSRIVRDLEEEPVARRPWRTVLGLQAVAKKPDEPDEDAAPPDGSPTGSGRKKAKKGTKDKKPAVDHRKQLFNDGTVGEIKKIQVSAERVTQLRGILFDLDPGLYRKNWLPPQGKMDPKAFYKHTVAKWLPRHPVLKKAEVRMTGTGLRVILNLDPPIVFEKEGERERWAAIVEIVQAALPIDPDQPGITATTRKLGSINSKSGATVIRLKKGEPVSAEEVEQLQREMIESPFRTVLNILTGGDRVTPCLVCGDEGTTLKALDHVGSCYGSCGKVTLDKLYATVLAPRPDKKKKEEEEEGGEEASDE